jgi:hypothetical protein
VARRPTPPAMDDDRTGGLTSGHRSGIRTVCSDGSDRAAKQPGETRQRRGNERIVGAHFFGGRRFGGQSSAVVAQRTSGLRLHRPPPRSQLVTTAISTAWIAPDGGVTERAPVSASAYDHLLSVIVSS